MTHTLNEKGESVIQVKIHVGLAMMSAGGGLVSTSRGQKERTLDYLGSGLDPPGWILGLEGLQRNAVKTQEFNFKNAKGRQPQIHTRAHLWHVSLKTSSHIFTGICITESLFWTPAGNTTLEINYISIKKKKNTNLHSSSHLPYLNIQYPPTYYYYWLFGSEWLDSLTLSLRKTEVLLH